MNFILTALVVIALLYMMNKRKVEGIDNWTKSQLDQVINSKTHQLIDVRTPMEYKSGHIKPFKNMPLNDLKAKAESLKKDQPIVVMCASGSRSMVAAKQLKSMGFTQVINFKGGISQYR